MQITGRGFLKWVGGALLALVEKTVAKANELAPDLIVLTGDYVLETAASIFDLAPA